MKKWESARGWERTVINMETCDSKEPYGGLALCEELLKKWSGHDRIHPMAAPHATNTNSPEMLKAAYDLACRYEAPYTLHVSEMDYEMELFREQYQKTPIEFLADLGVLGPRTIAAHCIHATDHDIALFAETGTKVAHCVGANTKGGKGVCPVLDMRNQGVCVGVGTDGPSSGNTLDLFTQFKMIASAQKTKYHSRGVFPAVDIVEMGTMGGARVLGAEQEIGSIEPGKKADLVLLETESVNMFPIYNVYSAIVYSANASNVDSVWVDGKRLVKITDFFARIWQLRERSCQMLWANLPAGQKNIRMCFDCFSVFDKKQTKVRFLSKLCRIAIKICT